MASKKVIVFDLDDTLFYEIEYLESAYRYIAMLLEEKYSISTVFPFMLRAYYDKKNVFDEVNKNYSLDIPFDTYLSLYRNHIPVINLNSETKKVLSVLVQTNNIILGLLTDGREITQRNKIIALGLNRYIQEENMLISESFGSEKPSLNNYLYFQRKYDNHEFIYIGDNVNKDFIAPNQLNWNTICLLDKGKNIHKQDFSIPSEYLPRYEISNMSELLELI
jgi:putative hydrolase of the HAD superfamily